MFVFHSLRPCDHLFNREGYRMIYAIIHQYLLDESKLDLSKGNGTMERAKKLPKDMDFDTDSMYYSLCDSYIERYQSLALQKKNPFKMYLKYSTYNWQSFISHFIKSPTWAKAKVIAGTVIMTVNAEMASIYSHIDGEYEIEIAKQWMYRDSVIVRDVYGVNHRTNSTVLFADKTVTMRLERGVMHV